MINSVTHISNLACVLLDKSKFIEVICVVLGKQQLQTLVSGPCIKGAGSGVLARDAQGIAS